MNNPEHNTPQNKPSDKDSGNGSKDDLIIKHRLEVRFRQTKQQKIVIASLIITALVTLLSLIISKLL